MTEIIKNKKLTLNYVPGNGAWTYHIVIPHSKEIQRKWGDIKVSGTIDGYPIENRNLAPVTNGNKMLSINSEIRKAIHKGGGDSVKVTLFRVSDNRMTNAKDILTCLRDVNVFKKFREFSDEDQNQMLESILSQPSEAAQERKINTIIKKLS